MKREAVLIGDQFVCPLCFTSDYRVKKCDVEKKREDKLRYTAICNRCGIQIKYNRKVPRVNELS